MVLALASCGGGGDDGGGDDVTEAQWRAAVTRVCTSNHLAVEKLVRRTQAEDLSQKELTVTVLRRSVSLETRMLKQLGAVRAPRAFQDDYDHFVDRLGDAMPLFDKIADDIEAGRNDPELTTAAAKLAADTRPFATEHHLTACLPDQN